MQPIVDRAGTELEVGSSMDSKWCDTMKVILIVAWVALCVAGCAVVPESPDDPDRVPDQERHQEAIRASVEDMQKAFMRGDLDRYLPYVHPDIVAMAGGADALRGRMESGLAGLVQTIEDVSIGPVSDVVSDAGRLVAFVPVETTYRFSDGWLLQKAYRIACSQDGGETWVFMDGQGRADQEAFFRRTFPVLTRRIPFPPCSSTPIVTE
jgi:hypothetical protein